MCGIVGFSFSNASLLEKMKKSIFHRGPDAEGSYIDKYVSLGHVRLSIIDLSEAGRQPMEFDGLVLIYNGEIYNYKEIKKELKEYEFVSDSDSEVLLKAYHKWGMECVEKLRGMFSFCIYDKKKLTFTVFRDRVGVKPLYYYFDGKDFVFSSEIRALREYKKLNIDKISLSSFFQFGYISEDMSIYKNVKKLLPAHYLIYDLRSKNLEIKKYWDVRRYFNISNKKENEIIDELEEVLIESVKYRMVSDAPVGVFLSGGVDSSLVSAVLQKHYGNIKTFTIGFNENKYNEAPYAKKVADYIGSEHTEKFLNIYEAKKILKKFVDIYDEPFGDSSGIPTFLVSQVAKENGVKVVLSADGGDELFCGYERYSWSYDLGKKFMNLPFKKLLAKSVGAFEPLLLKFTPRLEHRLKFLKNMLHTSSWLEIYETIIKQYRDDIKNLNLLNVSKHRDYFYFGEKIHPMQGMMLWDFYNYLPDDILVKVDRATMANSIEGREPLLDNRLIEYTATIPFEYKYKNNESKYILKKVLERYLPKEIIYRKKQGFGIPMFEWFRSDLIKLFEEYFKYDDDIVNMNYVRMLLSKFKSGQYVNVNKLWYVLVYLMWKERYY